MDLDFFNTSVQVFVAEKHKEHLLSMLVTNKVGLIFQTKVYSKIVVKVGDWNVHKK